MKKKNNILCEVPCDSGGLWTIYDDGTFIHDSWSGSKEDRSKWEIRYEDGENLFYYTRTPSSDEWCCDHLDVDIGVRENDKVLVERILLAQIAKDIDLTLGGNDDV